MKKIIFIGDTHFDLDIKKVVDYCAKHSKEELAHTTAIQLGDIGVIWYQNKCKKEEDILNLWDNFGFERILFIPGNHENYDRLFGDEFHKIRIDEIDGEVKQISKNMYMLLSGNAYMVNGKSIFCFRGAKSIDKEFRIKNVSWWNNEIVDMDEFENAKTIIRGRCFDYIVAHTGPKNFKDKLFGRNHYSDVTEDMLYNIIGNCDYKAFICGHYHLDVKHPKSRVVSLYNNILSEEEILAEIKGQNNNLEYVND
jgi:UDP-2,3-diacylglucosamine pyrophosphatase LpxH